MSSSAAWGRVSVRRVWLRPPDDDDWACENGLGAFFSNALSSFDCLVRRISKRRHDYAISRERYGLDDLHPAVTASGRFRRMGMK